ncbi:hypothetical protein PROFUN_15062 [Planoprotostelium fungivorum]|uniref:Uncharacterized protein n=1 Tax=Planoprotostelium fungivorum TaxID=1890364 RepID=A0A2P6MXT1_9EUKA|nr:hypothetical protein PROFUN_15062 [Planoprotostelium fungivorum]
MVVAEAEPLESFFESSGRPPAYGVVEMEGEMLRQFRGRNQVLFF